MQDHNTTLDKRNLLLCEKCKNLQINVKKNGEVERGPRTYSCAYADYEGQWRVWVDRHSFEEYVYPADNCFDKELPPGRSHINDGK